MVRTLQNLYAMDMDEDAYAHEIITSKSGLGDVMGDIQRHTNYDELPVVAVRCLMHKKSPNATI